MCAHGGGAPCGEERVEPRGPGPGVRKIPGPLHRRPWRRAAACDGRAAARARARAGKALGRSRARRLGRGMAPRAASRFDCALGACWSTTGGGRRKGPEGREGTRIGSRESAQEQRVRLRRIETRRIHRCSPKRAMCLVPPRVASDIGPLFPIPPARCLKGPRPHQSDVGLGGRRIRWQYLNTAWNAKHTQASEPRVWRITELATSGRCQMAKFPPKRGARGRDIDTVSAFLSRCYVARSHARNNAIPAPQHGTNTSPAHLKQCARALRPSVPVRPDASPHGRPIHTQCKCRYCKCTTPTR